MFGGVAWLGSTYTDVVHGGNATISWVILVIMRRLWKRTIKELLYGNYTRIITLHGTKQHTLARVQTHQHVDFPCMHMKFSGWAMYVYLLRRAPPSCLFSYNINFVVASRTSCLLASLPNFTVRFPVSTWTHLFSGSGAPFKLMLSLNWGTRVRKNMLKTNSIYKQKWSRFSQIYYLICILKWLTS